jgi:hypothetical protein
MVLLMHLTDLTGVACYTRTLDYLAVDQGATAVPNSRATGGVLEHAYCYETATLASLVYCCDKQREFIVYV